METKLLTILTRTPLHVGAGASVGAIDQPIQRERHTGFPIIPASALKGSFADHWNSSLIRQDVEQEAGKKFRRVRGHTEVAWLFGSDDPKNAFAGALLFSEARLLAFPIRSARGSFAWITCPMLLERAARDGVFSKEVSLEIQNLREPGDSEKRSDALFLPEKLAVGGDKIVLEECCLHLDKQTYPYKVANALADIVTDYNDAFRERLVIVSNGIFSHFVTTTCEVTQHVRISDETGAAEDGGLFNQENVPADTLFYSVLSALESRAPRESPLADKSAFEALEEFTKKAAASEFFQFGGDASTGLGFCTIKISGKNNRNGA